MEMNQFVTKALEISWKLSSAQEDNMRSLTQSLKAADGGF